MSIARLLHLRSSYHRSTPLAPGLFSAARLESPGSNLPTDTGRFDARKPPLAGLRWQQAERGGLPFPLRGVLGATGGLLRCLERVLDLGELASSFRLTTSRSCPKPSRVCAARSKSCVRRAGVLVLAGDADRHRIERDVTRRLQQDLVALAVNLQLAGGLVDSDPRARSAARRDGARRPAALDETARSPSGSTRRSSSGRPRRGAALRRGAAWRPRVVDVAASSTLPARDRARALLLCWLAALERATPATGRGTSIAPRAAPKPERCVRDRRPAR